MFMWTCAHTYHESSVFQIHTYVMLITTSDGPPSQPFWRLSTRDSQLITRNRFFSTPLRCHLIIGAYDAWWSHFHCTTCKHYITHADMDILVEEYWLSYKDSWRYCRMTSIFFQDRLQSSCCHNILLYDAFRLLSRCSTKFHCLSIL